MPAILEGRPVGLGDLFSCRAKVNANEASLGPSTIYFRDGEQAGEKVGQSVAVVYRRLQQFLLLHVPGHAGRPLQLGLHAAERCAQVVGQAARQFA